MTSRMAEDAAPRHAYQMRGMRLMISSTAVRGARKLVRLVGVLLDVELSQSCDASQARLQLSIGKPMNSASTKNCKTKN
jgi:hypothetical protein